MKLTNDDKAYLKMWSVPEKDFGQIAEAAKHTTYELCDKDGKETLSAITAAEAIERLGRNGWLLGLMRSAFHWTAMRLSADGENFIHFDSSKIFK